METLKEKNAEEICSLQKLCESEELKGTFQKLIYVETTLSGHCFYRFRKPVLPFLAIDKSFCYNLKECDLTASSQCNDVFCIVFAST